MSVKWRTATACGGPPSHLEANRARPFLCVGKQETSHRPPGGRQEAGQRLALCACARVPAHLCVCARGAGEGGSGLAPVRQEPLARLDAELDTVGLDGLRVVLDRLEGSRHVRRDAALAEPNHALEATVPERGSGGWDGERELELGAASGRRRRRVLRGQRRRTSRGQVRRRVRQSKRAASDWLRGWELQLE